MPPYAGRHRPTSLPMTVEFKLDPMQNNATPPHSVNETAPPGAQPPIVYDALILAGGKGSRMAGRDKGWVMWEGLPLVEHVLERLARQQNLPQRIIISANRNLDAYRQTGHPVVTDERAGFPGPLAGVEAGLMRCKRNWVLVVPCDTPLLPEDLLARLFEVATEQPGRLAAYATTSDGPQPLCCLLHPSVSGSLSKLLDTGHGSVQSWLDQLGAIAVPFDDATAFRNFNSMDMFDTRPESR